MKLLNPLGRSMCCSCCIGEVRQTRLMRDTKLIKSAGEHWVTVKGYENRWDLMEAPATDAPLLLQPEFRSMAQQERIGLTPEHPWTSSLPEW